MLKFDPIGIFLASSGSTGDRLLFRYPFETYEERSPIVKEARTNPYAVTHIEEDLKSTVPSEREDVDILAGYSDKILGTLLAVKTGLCGQKFEVKINDVLFVGYPMKVDIPASHSQTQAGKRERSIISFNVVIALHANTERLHVENYHQLVSQLAVALKHEQIRVGYLTSQKTIMWAVQDEVAARPEDSYESPYKLMLTKSSLAQKLKSVYEGLCSVGRVQLYINKWVPVSFCLPHKVHSLHMPKESENIISTRGIQKCLDTMRPYHAMLLLEDDQSLINSLPIDSSPSLIRLIQVTSPLKHMQNLATDADLSLYHVYELVSHLVYWGKAIIIYPLAENNTYMLSPNTSTFVNSSTAEKFSEQFPGVSLHLLDLMSEFSLPSQLSDHRNILCLPQHQTEQVQMVIFMLQHRLLIQLHTYVFFVPPNSQKMCASFRSSSLLHLSSLEEHQSYYKRMVSSTVSESDANSLTSNESQTLSSTKSVEFATELSEAQIASMDDAQWKEIILSGFSSADKRSVLEVPAASNLDDLKLFSQLCPYFDGKHHLEEIMFYENVHRSQLLELLDKFRSVLVTTQHEDPCTSCWVKQSDMG